MAHVFCEEVKLVRTTGMDDALGPQIMAGFWLDHGKEVNETWWFKETLTKQIRTGDWTENTEKCVFDL